MGCNEILVIFLLLPLEAKGGVSSCEMRFRKFWPKNVEKKTRKKTFAALEATCDENVHEISGKFFEPRFEPENHVNKISRRLRRLG